MKQPLTDRQELFCQLYASNPNATAAATEAGYSRKTAYAQGHRLLKNAEIIKRIRALQLESAKDRIAGIVEVQTTWTDLLRDKEAPTSARLKAGELLVKSGAGFLADTGDPDEELEDPTAGGHIQIPWVRILDKEPFNTVKLESGEIVPLAGSEDAEIWRYLSPFDPDFAQQIAEDESAYTLDEEDEE